MPVWGCPSEIDRRAQMCKTRRPNEEDSVLNAEANAQPSTSATQLNSNIGRCLGVSEQSELH